MKKIDSEADKQDQKTNYTFNGYHRQNRSIGIRNRILVLPSVICSQLVAKRIADAVPKAVSTPHNQGCGQIGADNEQTERALIGVASNPNVAGTLVVGLGCEHLQSEKLRAEINKRNIPVREIAIQDVGGVEPTVEAGIETANELQANASTAKSSVDLSDLTVGVVCSDLQQTSLSVAEPLVGSFVQTICNAGGQVLFANTERIRAHTDSVRSIAATQSVIDKFDRVIQERETLPSTSIHARKKASNHDFADLTQTWGDETVQDILRYGEPAIYESGLALVDSPSQFTEAATALAASGAQVLIHVTDDGIPTGHPILPVIKITGNNETYAALESDLDMNANETSITELHRNMMRVIRGDRSCSEEHDISDFGITRIGPSM